LHGSPELQANAFKHLTSRDPATFWTSGQWMTERTGGSDISGTSTVAKLRGTKALPTAELTLDGTPAELIGNTGEGVKRISSFLNITRLYNAVCSIGTIARVLALAKDYAQKREVFGRRLSEQPIHLQTLADLETEFQATFLTDFQAAHLLGREEIGSATTEEKALLRLLNPVIKLWSAKQALALVSEVIESFGGAGYIEDTGLPKLFRDAQVFPIW
jgi:putative acyl-CoA dehydrogenase